MTRRPKITTENVYEFLVTYIGENGYPPTVREIQQDMGVEAVSTIQRRLDQLRAEGRITSHPFKSRTIRVVE